MNINLITLATVKTHLGLSATTYDTQITAMIPIVSSDVRRILNNNFDKYVLSISTEDSTSIELNEYYPVGQVLQGTGIPDDTYLTDFNPVTEVYTMSAAATSDGTYVYPTVLISQFPTIAKMIFYRLSTATTGNASEKNIQSISYGPISKTFSESEINKKYNYPQSLINDLGTPYAKVG